MSLLQQPLSDRARRSAERHNPTIAAPRAGPPSITKRQRRPAFSAISIVAAVGFSGIRARHLRHPRLLLMGDGRLGYAVEIALIALCVAGYFSGTFAWPAARHRTFRVAVLAVAALVALAYALRPSGGALAFAGRRRSLRRSSTSPGARRQ